MPVAASATSPDDLRDGQPDPPNGLVLVSTPIGNLGDISTRARAVLGSCDLILCEDTRRTGRLLTAMNIHTRTDALHDHNEDSKIPLVLDKLRAGQAIGLVSDAGTPVVSDPGYRLVRAVIAAGLPVSAVPGPNAAITALILSGLPPLPFMFLGFPPPRQAARRVAFGSLRAAERAGLSATLIWHEAPHRLLETLADIQETFGDRSAAVARELTKRFETVVRGKVSELTALFTHEPARGEITVLIGPPEAQDPEDLDQRLRAALATQTVKDAAALVSTATGLPRKLVYARALQLHQEG
ncbi:16S rRNA (cytidine(1402)-2'-O)-methyltransferase [Rhodopila globiformis]|uniref:Ribosomal RNA small subunit methyltransferase I n=1 Tax=Rhodopila globiformis TaxID=1071 RepID=A0A2S6NIF9_RHOGL|nr:16S rRNA (cytidine(1402)-2'-O)-methyltransferase [Rhodopila globiformis]PPQ34388.1 16S rRNA (cytidine(1402)-2'-O)-methyltransferase [Rhodopila globiformis]